MQRVALTVSLLGLLACAEDGRAYRADDISIVRKSFENDGFFIEFDMVSGDAAACAGAEVDWRGNDVILTLVRDTGSDGDAVDAPLQNRDGQSCVFISDEHIPQGWEVRVLLTDGDATQHLGSYKRGSDGELPKDPPPPVR